MKTMTNAPVREAILKTLAFYGALGRPLAALEISRLLPQKEPLSTVAEMLGQLEAEHAVSVSDGFYSLKKDSFSGMERRQQDFLLDRKWKKLERLRVLFEQVPFIDFVLVAGSLAFGTAGAKSDFDVIIGCRKGRIFTVRLLLTALFGLFRVRRKRIDHKDAASDKACFNHFVTPERYILDAPHSEYWGELYKNLVPFSGNARAVAAFFRANAAWLPREALWETSRFRESKRRMARSALSFLLGGKFGDGIERMCKAIQLRRIRRNLGPESVGYKPRLRYDDFELEFHPDTRRIEDMEKKILNF